jgi:hypothetical protein
MFILHKLTGLSWSHWFTEGTEKYSSGLPKVYSPSFNKGKWTVTEGSAIESLDICKDVA